MNQPNTDCKRFMLKYFQCQGVSNYWKHLAEEGTFPKCRENIQSKKKVKSKNRISKMYE
jgi:hypothetical protein